MKKQIILGIIRHVLTGFGGVLVAKGLTDDSSLAEAVGAASTLIGFAWSVWHKKQTGQALALMLVAFGLGGLTGCASAVATHTNKDGSTSSVAVHSFLNSIKNGHYSETNSDGSSTTLTTDESTPDQQSIALLAGGLVDLGKAGLALAARQPTNAPAVLTNAASLDLTNAPAARRP